MHKEQQDIWESYQLNESHNPIPRVSCACDDCGYWREGNKCVAPKIELDFNKDDQGNTICECKTYRT